MKKFFTLLVTSVVLIISSCSDDDSSSNSLVGRWRMTQSCGGFAGCQAIDAKSATTLIIDSKSITWEAQGQVMTKIFYEVVSKSKGNGGLYEYEIKYNAGGTDKIQTSGLELYIGYSIGDAPFSATYKRIF